MWAWRVTILGALATGLLLAVACGRQSAVPAVASGVAPAGDEEQLPFDREGQPRGISPTSAVIPPGANMPAGTPVAVRLRFQISSAGARTGNNFDAVLDEPIIVNGQTVAERGTPVSGRLMEAVSAQNSSSPGYLRLVLTSIVIRGKALPVHTSSNFVKGGRDGMNPPGIGDGRATLVGAVGGTGRGSVLGASARANSRAALGSTGKDVSIGPERRLIFRLTEPVPLRPQEQ